MELVHYLQAMVENNASDLYLTAGAKPAIKIDGKMVSIDEQILSGEVIDSLVATILTAKQLVEFKHKKELNLALSQPGLGRFRVNIYQQRNTTAAVIRNIKLVIPSLEELKLPPILTTLIMQKRGFILFVGATGTGKSTSLASLLDYRNSHCDGHILTIEEPIEFVHSHKKSIVSQREVGIDTDNYEIALNNTLRQAPDVILIGEVRSAETMLQVIRFAETGQLCLSTLHAANANQAIERIISFFSAEMKAQLLLDLSLNLLAVISQRLVTKLDGKRIAAFEVLLATPFVCELIKRGEITALKEVMEKSAALGMQTFDQSLYQLYQEGLISAEEAIAHADSQQNLRMRMNLANGAIAKNNGLSLENFESEKNWQYGQDMLDWLKSRKEL